MNKKYFFVLILIFILIACNDSKVDVGATVQAAIAATQSAQPTSTPLPTNTPTPKPTPTKSPTATPEPTSIPTPQPPTATPTPYQPKLADIEPLGCKEDEFQGITWCSKYNTDDIEDHVISETDPSVDVAVYVGIKGKETFLRWNIDYVGNDWIFIDQITFLVDGKRYEVPVDEYGDIRTDICCGGKVFEYFDRLIDDTTLLLLIGASDEAKVRLSGKDGYIDHIITEREIIIIGRALATYEKNGGRFHLNLN